MSKKQSINELIDEYNKVDTEIKEKYKTEGGAWLDTDEYTELYLEKIRLRDLLMTPEPAQDKEWVNTKW